MLLVKQPNHLPSGNVKDPARGHRGRRRQANRLAGERPLTEEVARAQYPHDRLLPSLGQHRQLDPPLLNVENGVGGSTLRENDRRWCVGRRASGHPGRIEEGLGVKYAPCLGCHRYPAENIRYARAFRVDTTCQRAVGGRHGSQGFSGVCAGAKREGGSGQSCNTTLNSELLIFSGRSLAYSMKPSFWNLSRKKFTRARVVPIISASVSCESFGTARAGLSCIPYRASSNSVRANRFSLELKSLSTR